MSEEGAGSGQDHSSTEVLGMPSLTLAEAERVDNPVIARIVADMKGRLAAKGGADRTRANYSSHSSSPGGKGHTSYVSGKFEELLKIAAVGPSAFRRMDAQAPGMAADLFGPDRSWHATTLWGARRGSAISRLMALFEVLRWRYPDIAGECAAAYQVLRGLPVGLLADVFGSPSGLLSMESLEEVPRSRHRRACLGLYHRR